MPIYMCTGNACQQESYLPTSTSAVRRLFIVRHAHLQTAKSLLSSILYLQLYSPSAIVLALTLSWTLSGFCKASRCSGYL